MGLVLSHVSSLTNWFVITRQLFAAWAKWTDQLNTKTSDGYVALIDEKGIRIVAEGFCGTNEVRLDPKEEWLYVVESTGWHISRLRVQPDGELSDREIYGPSQLDGFPDGCAFDAFGNLWVTLIFTDQLVAITPDGEVLMLLDDQGVVVRALQGRYVDARDAGDDPRNDRVVDGEPDLWRT